MDVSTRLLAVMVGLSLVAGGCQLHDGSAHGLHGGAELVANPMFIPALDREFLWQQVVDAVDNHFKIRREIRIRQIGDVLIEGRIDTHFMDGSTVLEPWRKDSTHGFEKLHSTLQSTSRLATVRVAPVQDGFMIEVIVQKFVENVPRPQNATSSRKYSSHGEMSTDIDDSPPRDDASQSLPISEPNPWIPIGRDASLEQKILADIRSRVTKP